MQEIAEAARPARRRTSSPALAVGFETTGAAGVTIGIALIAPTSRLAGRDRLDRHLGRHRRGIFGTAVATMGMLMTAAYILAMDTFGPITDNAGGIVEMSAPAGVGARRSPTRSTRSATRPRR